MDLWLNHEFTKLFFKKIPIDHCWEMVVDQIIILKSGKLGKE